MIALEDACTCADGTQCVACEEWWQENGDLHDELQWPAYENPDLIERDYKPDPDAMARYHALKAAADKTAPHKQD